MNDMGALVKHAEIDEEQPKNTRYKPKPNPGTDFNQCKHRRA
jgi:hypothetical protein